MRCWAVACCGAAAWFAPACAAQPAPTAPTTETAIPWPTRAAMVVREVEVGPWALRWVGPFGIGGLEADTDDAGRVAEVLGVEAEAIEFEGVGSVVVRMPEGELSRTARLAGKPAAVFECLTADARPEGKFQLQRTWFALYEPRGGAEPRGVVLLLPGMFGTPEPVVDTLVGQLRDRGWHVLRLLTHSSRFTEKAAYSLDPADPTALAGEIAAELGDRAAECAIATEAVCAHIAETRPGVPIGARIGLGMSGGGMALPTVIAREHDAYTAAVFIGGGCDFAAIAMDSNYADWIDAVRIAWAEEPSDEARAAFTDAYRGAAVFDAIQTAGRMADLPMLMLHGTADRAVPAALGDLLWQRLGEPERWAAPVGHEALFLAYLPTRMSDLLDWLDALER